MVSVFVLHANLEWQLTTLGAFLYSKSTGVCLHYEHEKLLL